MNFFNEHGGKLYLLLFSMLISLGIDAGSTTLGRRAAVFLKSLLLVDVAGTVAHFGPYSGNMSKYTSVGLGLFSKSS